MSDPAGAGMMELIRGQRIGRLFMRVSRITILAALLLLAGALGAPLAAFAQQAQQPGAAAQAASPLSAAKAQAPADKAKKAAPLKLPPERQEAFASARLKASLATRLVGEIGKALAESRKKIMRPDISMKALGKVRGDLDKLRLKILKAHKDLQDPIATIAQQIKALGPPPKKGGEDPAIAAQRAALMAIQTQLQTVDKQLNLRATETAQLAKLASDKQRELFLSKVFEPSRSVLNPLLWLDGLATVPSFGERLVVLFSRWSANDEGYGNLAFLAVLALFAASFFLLIYVWRRWRRPIEEGVELDDFHRLWRAVRVAVYSAAVVFVTLVVLNAAIYTLSEPSPRIARFLDALTMAIFFSAVIIALARGIFRPATPHMRLVNISGAGALRAYRLISALAVLYSVDFLVGALAEVLFMPVSFSAAWSAFVSVLYVVLIALLMTGIRQADPLQEEGDSQRFFFGWARYVFHLVWLLLLVVLLALVAGYIALAHFITTHLIMTSAIVAGLYLLHHLVDAMVRNALDGSTYTGHFLRRTLSIPEKIITQLGVLFSTLVDIGIVLIGLPMVLMIWAINWVDMTNWARAAFFGFKVGNITIEPAAILTGAVVFIIALILGRLLTLWLDKRVLERTSLDTGVRHSILTTARYVTFIGAALIALSVAGVNFSSLAILGGALGIGIGFGLQSIVNNFVSGLILLAERPIKVGDWIKVNGGEGVVRKIKVRSTEIETFDRCSIIVPNSSLISEPVSNWYHGSRMGRIRLPIGVSYDADPDEVEKILLRCANAHPRTLAAPRAFVLFQGFGDNSLDFELRLYIGDIGYSSSTASDLRFAIFRALKEAGIEIPFPQRDVHLRTIPDDIFDRGGFPPRVEEA